ARAFDQPPRMRDMVRIEVVTLERDIRIGCREQRQPEALAEAELEHALRLERALRRTADRECRERHMARRRLAKEAGRVADVRDVALGPIHPAPRWPS